MLKIIIPSWVGLGFYRGVNYYNYNYKKEIKNYEKENNQKYYKKPVYFYSECFASGLFGFVMYANPITMFVVFPKEIYRLEVNIRNLNEEKEKDDFYRII